MEEITRALDKARAEDSTSLFPVGKDRRVSNAAPAHRSGLFDPDAKALSLNPKTLDKNRIVAWNKWDPRTPPFDILRTKVLRVMKERGWRTLGITSSGDGCGKSTVAINLALSMAHQVQSDVVLADFDLRRPKLATYLGVEPTGDLVAFLEGRASLTSCLVSAGGVQLRLVPNLGNRHNATELLARPQVEELMDEVRRANSDGIAVIDLPPLLVTDDALSVMPRVDSALLVVGEGVTEKAGVGEALRLLGGVNLIGVVHNGSTEKLKPYY